MLLVDRENLTCRTVDLGNPQLSMHSCRETGGSKDVESAVKLFKTFFEEFGNVEPFVYAGELKL
jgi:aspartyl aminopeptidase